MSQIGAVMFGGFSEEYEARRKQLSRLRDAQNDPAFRPEEVATAIKTLEDTQKEKTQKQLDVTG